MPPVSGLTYILKIYTGSSYVAMGGQLTTTFNRSTTEADATSKDSGGWHAGDPMIREASVDVEGFLIEGDAAYGVLETAWINGTQPQAQVSTPAGHTYAGVCTVMKLNATAPHENLVKVAVSVKFSGALTTT